MTLTTRTEMRRCGRRYATQDQALTSKRGLTGNYAAIPCSYGCGGWHLEDLAGRGETLRKQQEQSRKAPRDTGPSRKVRALVLDRDGYLCSRCGKPAGPGIGEHSLQHRKARGVGGDSSPSNLILLCGSATTGCHGHVEARQDPHDLAAGYRLESWQTPELEPVMYDSEFGSGGSVWLGDDGSHSFDGPVGTEAVA